MLSGKQCGFRLEFPMLESRNTCIHSFSHWHLHHKYANKDVKPGIRNLKMYEYLGLIVSPRYIKSSVKMLRILFYYFYLYYFYNYFIRENILIFIWLYKANQFHSRYIRCPCFQSKQQWCLLLLKINTPAEFSFSPAEMHLSVIFKLNPRTLIS